MAIILSKSPIARVSSDGMKILMLSALLTVAVSLISVDPVGASGCGMKPMKPMPPMGCKDLEAECVCDSRGDKCKWQWKCVSDKKEKKD